MIEYFAGDTRPDYEDTITMSGVAEDLSTGHTFEANLEHRATHTIELTKTTGITGSSAGAVTVNWAPGDLAIPTGTYRIQITVTRTVDSEQWTTEGSIRIKPKLVSTP